MADARAAAAHGRLEGLEIAAPSTSKYGAFLKAETVRSLIKATADVFTHTCHHAEVNRHLRIEYDFFAPWVRALPGHPASLTDEQRGALKASARVYVAFLQARLKRVGALVESGRVSDAEDFVLYCTVVRVLQRLRMAYPDFVAPSSEPAQPRHAASSNAALQNLMDSLGPHPHLGQITSRAARVYGHRSPAAWRRTI
ncbi:hypothetical protein BMF94_5457 [Rhodotorula taiwanensis]|uniref:Uncharacterized protein n=1 Tax=Rhodotorula taiwanensis TaxID=741276 RepID=A0A2S5B446_9BASI|nr:hypothetical protein BMF94_5457 [Rhodotorula taiwanensis]